MRCVLSILGCCFTVALLPRCFSRPECGPPRQELNVVLEGQILASGLLNLQQGDRGEVELRLSVAANNREDRMELRGRGVCRERSVAVEIVPGATLKDGSTLLGGRVELVNGALDGDRLFGVWQVEIATAPSQLRSNGEMKTTTVRGYIDSRSVIPAMARNEARGPTRTVQPSGSASRR